MATLPVKIIALIGSALMVFCEGYARKHGYKSIYCHAKGAAIPFYLKNKHIVVDIAFKTDELAISMSNWPLSPFFLFLIMGIYGFYTAKKMYAALKKSSDRIFLISCLNLSMYAFE
jgi:hypothetical protein